MVATAAIASIVPATITGTTTGITTIIPTVHTPAAPPIPSAPPIHASPLTHREEVPEAVREAAQAAQYIEEGRVLIIKRIYYEEVYFIFYG